MRYTIPAILLAVLLTTPLLAGEPKELTAARAKYQQASPHPSEADRERYVSSLAVMRAKMAAVKSSMDWQAVDAEMRRNPMPKASDTKALTELRIGKWESPRHGYLLRKDGTWVMLPAEPDATHGRWHIEGNRYFEMGPGDAAPGRPYTIILLNQKDFIYTDGEVVFYETRK